MKILQQKNLSWLILLFIYCLPSLAKRKDAFNEIICKSATIRSLKDFNALRNCTVIAGHVHIVQMAFDSTTLDHIKASNIEEITEYLLVYHVEGLDSLERLFPKLVVIRGVELLYDQYALIILENRDLQNIGLISLLRVLKGSIRVESNPSLCFTHTINWVTILGNNTKQYYYVMKNNKPPYHCPLCYTYQDELNSIEENRHKKCWSLGKFQKTILDYVGGKKCFRQGGVSNCLTSCSDNNCRHCTNYVSDSGCVDNCLPTKYRLAFKRQCVTNCSQWGLIQLGVECVEKCPKHYEEVKKNGKKSCVLNCKGNFVVNTVDDLEGLADCTTIEGSLTIELYEVDKPLVKNLEQAFLNLNEITGYLKILKSPQIVSLHFFKNLHTIQGLELIENMYSLYVVDNHYLEELWPHNVAISHGCVYFHLNPRLCYQKITDLQRNFKECNQITIKDASRNSNGERVICGTDIHALNATIADFNSTAAVVEVSLIPYDDLILLIGYAYYYKEAHNRNVTQFDGRHGCGQDSWFTDIVITKRRRHILKNLKPATQYAYFVKSMTTMDYPYQVEHVSDIEYFQTEPAKPGRVATIYTHALSPTQIEVHWWPPRPANGIIDKYILEYYLTNETVLPESVNQPKEDLCQCPKLDIESHIPTPHVEDHYNKEQWQYKDALSNFLFQKNSEKSAAKASSKNKTSSFNYTREESTNITSNELENQRMQKQGELNGTYVPSQAFPSCNQTDSNTQNETENKCTSLESSEEDTEIDGELLSSNETSSSNHTGDERVNKAFSQLEVLNIQKQEEAKETYVVTHSYPVCNQTHPNAQDQAENKCTPLETFEGTIEISGQRHSYMLTNLEPEKIYRISLRACVKDLPNGCGAEKVILAQTVSKSLETILENLNFHKV